MIKIYLKKRVKALHYFLICFFLLSLTACSTSRLPHYKGGLTKRDGAPRHKVDVSRIPDAVPKMEARSKYGNPKSYVVKGRRYHVMKHAKGYTKVGLASWYGTGFHGKPTSSREPYNLYGMTGASTHLPIPTYVRVTNLENGRNVIVKITDRGPFKRNRLIDLSYAAAEKLGYARKGTARVRVAAIDPVHWARERNRFAPRIQLASSSTARKTTNTLTLPGKQVAFKPTISRASGKSLVHLQVGVFSSRGNAEQLKTKLVNLVRRPVKVNRDLRSNAPLYRVQITSSKEDSSRLQKLLQRHGLKPLISTTG